MYISSIDSKSIEDIEYSFTSPATNSVLVIKKDFSKLKSWLHTKCVFLNNLEISSRHSYKQVYNTTCVGVSKNEIMYVKT